MLASKCNAYNTKQVDHILRPAPYTLHYNLHIGIDHSRKHHYKYIFINALIIDQTIARTIGFELVALESTIDHMHLTF